VGELVKEHQCYEGRDDSLDTEILDEEKLIDIMEPLMEDNHDDDETKRNGLVVDYHICEIFPERWFDLVLVLRCQTEVLFDRLTNRGYNEKKRSENMDAEIFQEILELARENYDSNLVIELPSNTTADMDSNIERVQQWMHQWLKDQTTTTK
jgi:adenylate kinase